MPVIHYINPVTELADAQNSISQAEQNASFAHYLVQMSIYGYGDPHAARQVLAVYTTELGHQRLREEFWNTMIKEDKNSMKKAWELVKD